MSEQSAAQEALRKVDSRLECGICLETYASPRVLPCFHVFCGKCLRRAVEKSRDKSILSCPNCRRDVSLPAGGVDELQSAFHIHHLFEIRETLVKAGDAQETKCEKCENAYASGYCRDCGQFVCDDCKKMHSIWKKEIGDHKIVAIADIESEAYDLVRPKTKASDCPKHPEKALEVYCDTCQQLICFHCTLREHQGHQHQMMGDVFPEHKVAIQERLEPLKKLLDQLTAAENVFDEREADITAKRMDIENQVQQRIKSLCQLLQQRKTELLTDLDQLTQQKLKSLTIHREELKLRCSQLLNCIDYVEGSLRTGSQEEVLAHKTSTLEQLNSLETSLGAFIMEPQESPSQVLEMKNVENMFKKLGVVRDTILNPENCQIIEDGVGQAVVEEESQVFLQTANNSGQPIELRGQIEAELVLESDKSVTKCSISEIQRASYSISYVPYSLGIHQLHVKIGQMHVKGSPYIVTVVDKQVCPEKCNISETDIRQAIEGEQSKVMLTTVNHTGATVETDERIDAELVCVPEESITKCTVSKIQKGTYSVSFVPQNRGTHQLHVKVKGKHVNESPVNLSVLPALTCFSEPATTFSGLQLPRGITINSKHQVLAVENGADQISIMSADGEKIKTFGSSGSENGQLNSPSGVTVDNNDNIYIADGKNHRIQKFDENGQFLATVGELGTGNLQFKYPRGIAYNKRDGLLYICDTNNHRLQAITTDLHFSKTIGTPGTKQSQFRSPWDVAIDSQGQLYVAEDGNARIQVLNIEGEYLHTIGDKEMERPLGVAIDTSGRVFVAEHTAHRISVFKGSEKYLGSFQVDTYPIRITLDPETGHIFIAVSGSSKIIKF